MAGKPTIYVDKNGWSGNIYEMLRMAQNVLKDVTTSNLMLSKVMSQCSYEAAIEEIEAYVNIEWINENV